MDRLLALAVLTQAILGVIQEFRLRQLEIKLRAIVHFQLESLKPLTQQKAWYKDVVAHIESATQENSLLKDSAPKK